MKEIKNNVDIFYLSADTASTLRAQKRGILRIQGNVIIVLSTYLISESLVWASLSLMDKGLPGQTLQMTPS